LSTDGEAGEAAAAVADRFALPSPTADVRPMDGGHINRSYLVTCEDGTRFVLQRVNRHVFAAPEQVMANIVTVTAHLARTAAEQRAVLRLLRTRADGWWHTDAAGEVWRCYYCIEGSADVPTPLTPETFRLVGEAFGGFLRQLDDLPADRLHTTIAHFHDEPRYLARLRAVAAADPCGRANGVRPEIAHALSFEAVSHDFDAPGLMPWRVVHNDAKVSNLLLDATTGRPLAVIDLDTVQPGFAVNDVGDAVRSGAATLPEDARDGEPVRFVPELFEAFVEGYLGACGDVLTIGEITHLRHGVRLMTLEACVRFLTDYLEGDVYYRVDHPGHNLDRARNQAALLDDVVSHWDDMGRIVGRLAKGGC